MRTEYEEVVKGFMPALRGVVARAMANEYNIRQVEIASLIGVTQAEVSKYINGKQPKANRLKFDKGKIDALVGSLLKRHSRAAQKVVCSMCPKGSAHSCTLMAK